MVLEASSIGSIFTIATEISTGILTLMSSIFTSLLSNVLFQMVLGIIVFGMALGIVYSLVRKFKRRGR